MDQCILKLKCQYRSSHPKEEINNYVAQSSTVDKSNEDSFYQCNVMENGTERTITSASSEGL